MSFTKKQIKTTGRKPNQVARKNTGIKTRYATKKKKYLKSKNKGKIIFKIMVFLLLSGILLTFLMGLILYKKYLSDLPSVDELETLEIAEASTIYDKDNNELYSIFKENRTYVPFEDINKNIINALVAGEDKRYWENPGFDLIGLSRAVIYRLVGKSNTLGGTSTLTQQLIRNTIIENRNSAESLSDGIERKVKEIYLSYKLTNGVSKEKILELYLNKIAFGSNAHGIEQASLTFFDKQAIDINVLEASILASLPKGPTYYSPYNHPERVLGYPYIYKVESPDEQTKVINQTSKQENQESVTVLTDYINSLKAKPLTGSDKILICGLLKENFKVNINVDNDGCALYSYNSLLSFLNSIRIELSEETNIEYQTGRKDFILGRMLEDGYIDFEEYKNSIVNGMGFSFKKAKENIKYPHFVFYVKEYLEEKYGKEVVSIGGLKIYTTIDPKLQDKAEEIVSKYAEINSTKFGADNAALVSLDNETGDILAMVGGKDYFDQDNGGNVNMVNSRLQPGSTFKPFVYAMALFNNKLGTKTPVYDVRTKFPGSYEPSNFDGKFIGKMNISTALNYSRNIPAVKMYYLAGGEKDIVAFMKKLGVDSLKNHGQYGAPLSLGTGEMTPLELASAYSVFANMGVKKNISPIIRVEDSKGNLIEQRTDEDKKGEEVISPDQAYLINSILSDTTTRPTFWNRYLTIDGRSVAAKTGTSTKQYQRNGKKEIFPRNLWTAGYTPQITTVAWAGNTDGKELFYNGSGLEGAGSIWRDFMQFAHAGKEARNWSASSGVKKVSISNISGLLPSESSRSSFNTESLFINSPTETDRSFSSTQVDILCNGQVTNNTPSAAIRDVNLVQLNSLRPSDPAWEGPVQIWAKSNEAKSIFGNAQNVITSMSNEQCIREGGVAKIFLKSTIEDGEILTPGENFLEVGYKSDTPLTKLEIFLGDSLVESIDLEGKKEGTFLGNVFISASQVNKKIPLKIRVLDSNFYSDEQTNQILVVREDIVAPEINIINPESKRISVYEDEFFNLRVNIIERSKMKSIKVFLDTEEISRQENKNFSLPVNRIKKYSPGNYTIRIEAVDSSNNKTYEEIEFNVIPR